MVATSLLRPMPAGLRFWHPAALLATWFGVGLIRVASGTCGSLAALPAAVLIVWAGGQPALAAAAVLATLLGIWAAGYIGRSGERDSSAIVIDEVAGQWLSLVPVALDLKFYVIGFLLFRLLDITKPWPASWIDRRMGGELGVMLDDVVAGLYVGILLRLLGNWIGVDSCFPNHSVI